MKILVAGDQHAERWNNFVTAHPAGVNYLRWQWKYVMDRAFGWRSFYLLAEESGQIHGVLPLVWQKSRLFGNVLSSMPYFSEAGILATSKVAEDLLLSEAISLARNLKSKHLELRQMTKLAADLPLKSDRVAMVLDLYPAPEKMIQQFDTKMRSDVRRSSKRGLEAEFGAFEFLDDFYEIFACKMRDLGTPVYSKRFFEQMLAVFPEESFICRVRSQQKIVGASFMTGFRHSIEYNWAVSLPEGKDLMAGTFMAWQSMCFAAAKGYRLFDFGRSSIGSPTYNFKLHWNTRIIPLYWYQWSSQGEKSTDLDRRNPKFRAAIELWKRLPLSVTKVLGPPIARCIP
jgi:FemAB-related protein (PEP-CTERM system-associated)